LYYLYFPYAALVASAVFYESWRHKFPRWWALAVFLAPVTTPFFIFKAKRESGIILIMIFTASFAAVCAGEIFLYSSYVNKHRYSDLPPVTRQMIYLSNELKLSTLRLDKELAKLEGLSKVESRIEDIKTTIEYIHNLRKSIEENQAAIQKLLEYTAKYHNFFSDRELAWVSHIRKFYHNRIVSQHYKSLQKYLDAFEALLTYTYVNFYNITQVKDKKHLENYDAYYLRYRRAVDMHNKFNVRRIEFQNAFLKKYPDVKPYLPGERQTKAFRLWG
jgi:hypothetical protein